MGCIDNKLILQNVMLQTAERQDSPDESLKVIGTKISWH